MKKKIILQKSWEDDDIRFCPSGYKIEPQFKLYDSKKGTVRDSRDILKDRFFNYPCHGMPYPLLNSELKCQQIIDDLDNLGLSDHYNFGYYCDDNDIENLIIEMTIPPIGWDVIEKHFKDLLIEVVDVEIENEGDLVLETKGFDCDIIMYDFSYITKGNHILLHNINEPAVKIYEIYDKNYDDDYDLTTKYYVNGIRCRSKSDFNKMVTPIKRKIKIDSLLK